jgi:hypothetical protein
VDISLPLGQPCLYFFSLWLYRPLDLCRFFSFIILYTVGRTPWTRDLPVARPLPKHRTRQIETKRTQTFMPQVGFEPTIPVFKQVKAIHSLDRAATVINLNAALRCSCKMSMKIVVSEDRASPLQNPCSVSKQPLVVLGGDDLH